MAQIRVPVPLRDTAREIDAEKWARARRFRRREWFEMIGEFRKPVEAVSKLAGSDSFEQQTTVGMIALAINAEDSLAQHVLDCGIKVDDDSVWAKMCTAAAWVLLQEYDDAKKRERGSK